MRALAQKKYALTLASLVLLAGLYFSTARVTLAPYFLVVHAALSDAYLLPMGTRLKDSETMKLIKTVLYSACFGLLILDLSSAVVVALLVVAALGFSAVLVGSTDRSQVMLFELPIVALVLYAELQQVTFGVHLLGFYHIMTWYAFSAWMLGVKERNYRKLGSFFGMVAGLSFAFVLVFDRVLGYSITDVGFASVIGFWSLLHITSTIPLSKFNPRVVKALFYAPRAA